MKKLLALLAALLLALTACSQAEPVVEDPDPVSVPVAPQQTLPVAPPEIPQEVVEDALFDIYQDNQPADTSTQEEVVAMAEASCTLLDQGDIESVYLTMIEVYGIEDAAYLMGTMVEAMCPEHTEMIVDWALNL